MKFRTIRSAVLMFALAATLSIVPAVAQGKNPEAQPYFGETYLHTSWKLDAWTFGNRITGPDDAYKFPQIREAMGYIARVRFTCAGS